MIAATAANLVYTLPNPRAGMRKRIYITYEGNTDDLIVACAATSQSFNGTAANTVVVSSSMTTVGLKLYGLSTAKWGIVWSGPAISTSLIFTATTIASSTDRT